MAVSNNRKMNQGVWIGDGFATENATSLFLGGQLGMVFTKAGKTYQLFRSASGADAIIANVALAWVDFDDFTVTDDISDAARNRPAGIAIGTLTASNYGWIQVGGPGTGKDDGNNAADATILFLSATDGALANTAAGTAPTYIPMGVATAAASGAGGTIAMYIQPPHNQW